MIRLLCATLVCAVGALGWREAGMTAAETSERISPQPFPSLKQTLTLRWQEVAPLPVVMNGGMVGRVGERIVYATAFGRKGPPEILTNGYTNATWVYTPVDNTWRRLPDFPGAPRAYGTATGLSDGTHAYILGGQSYTPPYVYADVYRLGRTRDGWLWENLPSMLWPTAEFGACLSAGKLYVQGGAFWSPLKNGEVATGYWCTQTSHVGVRFQVLDLNHLDRGWMELPPLPGVHRTHHTLSAAGGKLYVLGGIAMPSQEKDPARRGVFNTVDDYCYDPATQAWTRVRDMPLPLGGHAALTYRDRYILLMGGFSGRKVLTVQGMIRDPYGVCQGFEDRVFVYDTQTNLFSLATPMRHKINDPRPVWIDEDSLFEATGEIAGGRRIPNCQIGTVASVAP